MFLDSGWLNLITHALFCLITLKPKTAVQLVMSSNLLKVAGYHE
jgi:hypothetical protein